MQGHKNEGKHIPRSKGSYRAGMEENRPTVTELAGWGSDTAALRVQCPGRTLITTLLSSPKANFLTRVLRDALTCTRSQILPGSS